MTSDAELLLTVDRLDHNDFYCPRDISYENKCWSVVISEGRVESCVSECLFSLLRDYS
jgi:hypothetical protein